MILVTTAGKVGAEAARLLAQLHRPVRVLLRNDARAATLTDLGIDTVIGDLSRPETIDAALDGVAAVILVSPAVLAEEVNVIDASVRAGVGHVVKVTSKSSLDSSIPRRRTQAEIENALIASGLGYTLLRNNAYMQNFLMLAPQIASTGAFGSSAGDGRIGMVDTRDVAAVAAGIAAEPADHTGRTYWLTGPQRLSYGDAAAVLSRVVGRPVTYHPLTVEQQTQAMVDAGMPEALAAMNARALELFATGDSDWVTDDVRALTARAPRSFDEFASENAAAFGART